MRKTCWKKHGCPTISQSHVTSQHNGGNWQQYQTQLHPPPQSTGEKSELEILKARLNQLEDLISNSSSTISSTSVANSGKNFILSKILTITSLLKNSLLNKDPASHGF